MTNSQDHRPHAHDLRIGRFSEPYGLYLLTKCVEAETDLSIGQKDAIVSALLFSADKGDLRLHAFVVMPDHWHALISLGPELLMGRIVENIDRRANYQVQRQGRISWQKGFHDKKVRINNSVKDIVHYVEYNPVRKGLTNLAEAWKWSSANVEFRKKTDRSFLGFERWA